MKTIKEILSYFGWPIKKSRMISIKDGLRAEYFVLYGQHHLIAAEKLLKEGHSFHFYCDSAGYLIQLGTELFLKGWLLFVTHEAPMTHSLTKLYKELERSCGAPLLSEEQQGLLRKIGGYYELRYQDPNNPEIGSDDWEDIDLFLKEIYTSMPGELIEKVKEIPANQKGNRILMWKRRINNPRLPTPPLTPPAKGGG